MTKTEAALLAAAAKNPTGSISVTLRCGRKTYGRRPYEAALEMTDRGLFSVLGFARDRTKGCGFYSETTYLTYSLRLTAAGRAAAGL